MVHQLGQEKPKQSPESFYAKGRKDSWFKGQAERCFDPQIL